MNPLQHLITAGYGQGLIAFNLYERLYPLLDQDDGAARSGRALAPRPSIFPPKRRQPRPDPCRSRQRKRGWASDNPMPRHLNALFTEGERAAVAVVLKDVRFTGRCVKPVKQIASEAGVGESTARNGIRMAQRHGLVRVTERRRMGRPNLPNIIEVISAELRAWLKGGGFKPLKPTQNQEFRKKLPEGREAIFRDNPRLGDRGEPKQDGVPIHASQIGRVPVDPRQQALARG